MGSDFCNFFAEGGEYPHWEKCLKSLYITLKASLAWNSMEYGNFSHYLSKGKAQVSDNRLGIKVVKKVTKNKHWQIVMKLRNIYFTF